MIRPVAVGARQRFRILVVEDYEDAAQSMAILLGLHGDEAQTQHRHWWRILSPTHVAGCSAANREQRIRANGVPTHYSLSRITLIAAAVRRC
jgi:hypothetical protein